MKRLAKQIVSLALAITLMLSALPTFAAFSDFPDVTGHWAEAHLERAYEDGLLNGFEDGKMHPNAAVSYEQVLALICRMLSPINTVNYSDLGLSGNEWYADYAAKTSAMGLPFSKGNTTRGQIFELLVLAFELRLAEPNLLALNAYSDLKASSGAYLYDDAQLADFASLLSQGYIQGYDGKLNVSSPMTRAELVTLLYRIVDSYSPASDALDNYSDGIVLSGEAKIEGKTFLNPVFLDCTTEKISFKNVTAGLVVIRSQLTNAITFSGNTNIDRLVISGGTGKSITISPSSTNKIDTLVIGDYHGNVTIGGNNIQRVEIVPAKATGRPMNVTINGNPKTVVISGDGNTVNISGGTALDSLQLPAAASNNTVTVSRNVDVFAVDGRNNTVTVNSTVTSFDLRGGGNTINGRGKAKTATIHTTRSTMELKSDNEVDNRDYGIEDAGITLSAPSILPVGQTLTVTATLENPLSRNCIAVWYVDGKEIRRENITVGPDAASLSFSCEYEYSETMQTSSNISFTLLYTTADGNAQSVSRIASIILENYDAEYYAQYNREAVLANVTSPYKGNWTTEWAVENDYDERTKTIWINAKGHSSTTEYLAWINIAYQKVNIFKGSAGNWELEKTFLCGTGALYTPTPIGVYTIWARSSYGWTTGTYNVRPVVNFKTGSGYAFHSRLYNPAHTYLTDPSIGFPVSHGCIRMYDEDVQWIYDNLPNGTTVVVF